MAAQFDQKQINTKALFKLSELFQREVSSLVEFYMHDSKKLMEKLRKHFQEHSFEQITSTARELRENSLEVGASQFSFFMLGLEIAASEHRIDNWWPTLEIIEQKYTAVIQELKQMTSVTNSHHYHQS